MIHEETYTITGMTCAACSSAVERVTRKLDGVEASNVNLATGKLTIRYDTEKVTPDLIIAKVDRAGFGCQPFKREEEKTAPTRTQEDSSHLQDRELRERKHRLIGAWIFTLALMYGLHAAHSPSPAGFIRWLKPSNELCPFAAASGNSSAVLRKILLYKWPFRPLSQKSKHEFPCGTGKSCVLCV